MSFPIFPEFECGEDSCATKRPIESLGKVELEICIHLEDGSCQPSERQLEVLEHLYSPIDISKEIAKAAQNYFRKIDEEVGLEDEGTLIDENHIELDCEFLDATIPKHNDCDTAFVLLGMNCDWEEEHGMHILLVDGQVAYCGSCATLFFGSGWKQVISAVDEQSRMVRLNELIGALPY